MVGFGIHYEQMHQYNERIKGRFTGFQISGIYKIRNWLSFEAQFVSSKLGSIEQYYFNNNSSFKNYTFKITSIRTGFKLYLRQKQASYGINLAYQNHIWGKVYAENYNKQFAQTIDGNPPYYQDYSPNYIDLLVYKKIITAAFYSWQTMPDHPKIQITVGNAWGIGLYHNALISGRGGWDSGFYFSGNGRDLYTNLDVIFPVWRKKIKNKRQ